MAEKLRTETELKWSKVEELEDKENAVIVKCG